MWSLGTIYVVFMVTFVVTISPGDAQLPPSARPCFEFLCRCDNITADCSGSKLTFIPKLETANTIKNFLFSGNLLSAITNDTFQNISHFPIAYLELRYNNIVNISAHAFVNLSHLMTLGISFNPVALPELYVAFRSMPDSFSYVYLEGLGIADDNLERLLGSLEQNNIAGLHLADNYLTTFNLGVFSKFLSLATISMERNNISSVYISNYTLVSLSTLWLNYNSISTMPNFCHNGSKKTPAIPRLYTLSLEYNNIQLLDALDFRCLKSVGHLFLSGNRIQLIQGSAMKSVENLQKLNISDNAANLSIKIGAFNVSQLKWLNLTNSRIASFDVDALAKVNCSLDTLDLSNNPLKEAWNDRLEVLLEPCLESITKIICNNCSLTKVPGVVRTLKRLNHLSLDDNKILTVKERMFDNNHHLRELYLGYNKITSIGDDTISNSVRSGLTNASLEGNPFVCSCVILWLRNWLIRARPLFSERLSHYQCTYPGESSPERIVDDPRITNGACYHDDNRMFTVLISVGVVLLCFVCFALGYKFRWYFRYRLKWRNTFVTDEMRPLLGHDLYILYCDDDFSWVRYKALPKLEERGRLKVCFRQRDFNPKDRRMDSAMKNLQNSKHVLFVLSNSFFKDKESVFELSLVRQHRKDSHQVIVVALEDVDDRYMSQELYRLLKGREHIKWAADENEDVVWHRILSQISNV